jgi:putative Mg2+ transporter-C (MgtC) family protein
MVLSTQQAAALSGLSIESIRVDPARMAQGIMTGIGFLGAGVIMREGLSVRGLTTAASIWITAAIGVILGAGFYAAAAVATLLTLATLSVFRWLERIFPSLIFARLIVRSAREPALNEEALRELIRQQGISCTQTSYRLAADGSREYELTIQSRDTQHFRALVERLSALPQVLEYFLSPSGEK